MDSYAVFCNGSARLNAGCVLVTLYERASLKTVQKPSVDNSIFVQHFAVKVTLVIKSIFWVAVLLSGSMATAQQTVPEEPIWHLSRTSWAEQNRFLEVFTGQRQQDYRETDTQALTRNGVLDTETGNQNHIGVALRWQTANGWLMHLQAQRQSGATDYSGYLQAGNGSLTPYRARTGNTAIQFSVNLGYALNTGSWSAMPANWQVTPLVQIGQHHWERNLVQYGETYDYTTQAMGALVQWQARSGTVLEVQALVGRTQSASVSVPALGFAAEQPGDSLREWQVGISQDLSAIIGTKTLAGWHVTARYSDSQYGHGVSQMVKGLQSPPNQHRSSIWMLGLQKQF